MFLINMEISLTRDCQRRVDERWGFGVGWSKYKRNSDQNITFFQSRGCANICWQIDLTEMSQLYCFTYISFENSPNQLCIQHACSYDSICCILAFLKLYEAIVYMSIWYSKSKVQQNVEQAFKLSFVSPLL